MFYSMKRHVATLLLSGLLLLTPYTAWSEEGFSSETSATFIETARDAVVLVAVKNESGQDGFGTGFIISPDGLAVTNYHVIHRATEIIIWFYDRSNPKEYSAEVIAIDPLADIALLQLKVKEDMLPLQFLETEGDIESMRVGDEVIAIGHLLGLNWSVTKGHISSLYRGTKASPYVKTLQHSAPINRGSSGGPLINNDGKVIGVNTYVLNDKRRTFGVGYAIRGDYVHDIIIELRENGKVTRASFGVKFAHLHRWSRKKYAEENPEVHFPNTFGLLALDIEEDSWAYKQGLRTFDTVLAVDNRPTNMLDNLVERVLNLEPGIMVNLIVSRDGAIMHIKYTLKELEFDHLTFYDKVDEVTEDSDKETQ